MKARDAFRVSLMNETKKNEVAAQALLQELYKEIAVAMENGLFIVETKIRLNQRAIEILKNDEYNVNLVNNYDNDVYHVSWGHLKNT